MDAAIVNQLDVILPLLENVGETPRWTKFMTALLARTQARRGILLIALANAPSGHEPTMMQLAAPRAIQQPAIDVDLLMQLGLHTYSSLRPGRVYALDELLNYDDSEILAHQRQVLSSQGIRFGRWLRVSAEGVADAWILLTRERDDFTASAVTTLSAIAPYLRAALRSFVILSEQHLLRIMSQATLGRLGIGQIALDETGRVMAADSVASRYLTFVETPDGRPGRRLQLPPASLDHIERACAEFALPGSNLAAHTLIEVQEGLTLMLQPTPFSVLPGMAHPAAIATLRIQVREDERRGAAVLRDQFRLSTREAALAEKLSRGEMIVEAGRQLHLTEETARNYSKRIYARTGSRGQADLVRTILCGLAPLA